MGPIDGHRHQSLEGANACIKKAELQKSRTEDCQKKGRQSFKSSIEYARESCEIVKEILLGATVGATLEKYGYSRNNASRLSSAISFISSAHDMTLPDHLKLHFRHLKISKMRESSDFWIDNINKIQSGGGMFYSLSVRTRNGLSAEGITDDEGLMKMTDKELLNIPYFGKISLQEVKEYLASR